jgi:hypothetical protein
MQEGGDTLKREVPQTILFVAIVVAILIGGVIRWLSCRDNAPDQEDAPNFETRDERANEEMQINPPREAAPGGTE